MRKVSFRHWGPLQIFVDGITTADTTVLSCIESYSTISETVL